MNKRVLLYLLLSLGSFIPKMVAAMDSDATTKVQQKLAAIRTMQAHFKQSIWAKSREISQSRGIMALSRPHRFRWQTQSPMAQTVIADGHKLWVYDVELEQVTVSPQNKKLGAATALFLSQEDDVIRHDFTVTSQTKDQQEIYDLKAKSSKAQFENVRLIFIQEQLKRIELDDQLGQHTIVNFSVIKTNQSIPDRLFVFRIPTGVDVVQQ